MTKLGCWKRGGVPKRLTGASGMMVLVKGRESSKPKV